MTGPGPAIRNRFGPALLGALGVTLLAAGLLTYTAPVDAEPVTTPVPTPSATAVPTPSPRLTLPPLSTASPTPPPSATPQGVATRVRIAALDIDMPVIAGNDGYPYCNVAMYLEALAQPGQGRASYIYAHARTGMFLPLLETPGPDQLGMVVEVWTSDDLRYLYEIVEVRRDQRDLLDAQAATREELWLQTSEGPRGTPGKTQVIALPLSVENADPVDANPEADPVACG